MQQLYEHNFRSKWKSNLASLICLNSSFVKSYQVGDAHFVIKAQTLGKEEVPRNSQALPMPCFTTEQSFPGGILPPGAPP